MCGKVLTTGDVAELLGVELWCVQRVFEVGFVAEPPKFGGRRAVPSTMIPAIVDALRERRWLPLEAAK